MLWVVTVVAVAFIFFPSYIGAFRVDRESLALNDNYDTVTLAINGMTCEACATTLENELAKVSGVSAAEVNYEKKEALLGFPKGANVPRKELLTAVSSLGYSGQFIDLQRFSLPIEGMTCEACASGLQAKLAKVPGVSSAKVEYDNKKAVVIASPMVARKVLVEAIIKTGYKVGVEISK
jgi:copper ion binding protein